MLFEKKLGPVGSLFPKAFSHDDVNRVVKPETKTKDPQGYQCGAIRHISEVMPAVLREVSQWKK